MARGHEATISTDTGWGQATLLVLCAQPNPDRAVATKLERAYDCTESMTRFLKNAAEKAGLDYAPPTGLAIRAGTPPEELATVKIKKSGKSYWVELDKRSLDVSKDVRRLLRQRLSFVADGVAEHPRLGTVIPPFHSMFEIPPVSDSALVQTDRFASPVRPTSGSPQLSPAFT